MSMTAIPRDRQSRQHRAGQAQDAAFVAETQRGASSPAYVPGPIGGNEYMVNLSACPACG